MLTELFTELERVEFREAVLDVGTVSVLESSDILSSKLGTARIVEFIRERDCLGDLGDFGAESSDLPLTPLTDAWDMTTLIVSSEACARVGQDEPAARSITGRANESLCVDWIDRWGRKLHGFYRDRRVRQGSLCWSMSMLAPRLLGTYRVGDGENMVRETMQWRTSRTADRLWEEVRHRNRYLDMHSRPPRVRLR